MRFVLLFLAVISSATASVVPAYAAGPGPSAFQRIYGSANPPYGFVRFCSSFPQDCAAVDVADKRVEATPVRFAELDAVNRSVNKAIEPVTDLEQYGVEELWTLPTTGKGDCEEYVLVKRRLLMQMDWPTSSLLITVVLDENKQGHAVLTARTSGGDLVLDNKHDQIKIWSATPYTFLVRQSFMNPMAWVSLDAKDTGSPAAIAGVRTRN